ncbi:hypothetical protein KHQ06_33415 [Nocardia tengchongensis]|uniref:Uncharacterized protein n=1 Tax=Nocardia tengchongensis TaxID=2055889 RepID=A0ABX8CNJ5_9NOCA|nr:hypothetical protein [Nocardia tengchongensis]QVI20926.1 hypothetical protein KHQ06_33415 [Nocardia tengchongensis]
MSLARSDRAFAVRVDFSILVPWRFPVGSDHFHAFLISSDQVADMRFLLCWSGFRSTWNEYGTEKRKMWSELGKTVRTAMKDWPALLRFVICVVVLTAAAALLLWMGAR